MAVAKGTLARPSGSLALVSCPGVLGEELLLAGYSCRAFPTVRI